MGDIKTKRMRRVLKVVQNLRQLEEAKLGLLQRKARNLKSAQNEAIRALNREHDGKEHPGAGFAQLYAAGIRRRASEEQQTEEQAERQRGRLAQRRGQEKITENFVDKLNKQHKQRLQAAQLQDVLESYGRKPPASNS